MLFVFYYSIIVLFAYLGQNDVTKNKTGRTISRIFVAILMSIPIAISTTGTDRSAYLDGYGLISSLSDVFSSDYVRQNSWEYGFSLVCYLGNLLGLNPVLFLFFVSFITNILFVNVVYRLPMPFFSVLCLCVSSVYFQENNLVRQLIAIAFFMNALLELKNKKYLIFILLIILASLFHKSAIYLLFFVALPFFKLTDKKLFRFVLAGLWMTTICIYFGIINVNFLDIGLSAIDQTYEGYVQLDNTMGIADISVIQFLFLNFLVVLLIIQNPKIDIFICMVVLAACGLNIRENMFNLARFFLYFTAFVPFYITTIIQTKGLSSSGNEKIQSVIRGLLIFYYVIYQFLFISLRGGHSIFQ